MFGNQNLCVGNPVCCPPVYCVRDYCTPRIVPVIQPVVTVNRRHIVNVPQYYTQQVTRNVVVDQNVFAPGFGNAGFGGSLF